MVNDFYYNDGKKITMEEAHALKDKSKLIVSDKEIKFKKEEKDGSKRHSSDKRIVGK